MLIKSKIKNKYSNGILRTEYSNLKCIMYSMLANAR